MILFWLISLAHYELNCRVLQVSWQCRLRLFAESCPEQLENPATENKSVFYIAWPAEGELNIEYRPWTPGVCSRVQVLCWLPRTGLSVSAFTCKQFGRFNNPSVLLFTWKLWFTLFMLHEETLFKKKTNILVFISFHCMARMAYRE